MDSKERLHQRQRWPLHIGKRDNPSRRYIGLSFASLIQTQNNIKQKSEKFPEEIYKHTPVENTSLSVTDIKDLNHKINKFMN